MARSPALTAWFESGEWFDFRGHKVFYQDRGEGDVLVLIHGFPTASWDWHRIIEPLSQHYRVLALDLLGLGFSDKPDIPYRTDLHADLIADWLAHLRVADAHLMSYSYGVSICQELMARQWDAALHTRLHTVFFMNGGVFPASNHPNLTQRLLLSPVGPLLAALMGRSTMARNLRSVFGPDTQPSQALLDEYWYLLNVKQGKTRVPAIIQYLRDRPLKAERWLDSLRRWQAPVYLLTGECDAISGVEVVEEFRRKLPHQEAQILSNIGHYPQLECPQVVIDKYLDFRRKADTD